MLVLRDFPGSPDISVLSKSPCLVCSDLDHPMEQLKLSAIKLDSRFTTSAQMIKLMGHFEVCMIYFAEQFVICPKKEFACL